jgi:hypothetical protein
VYALSFGMEDLWPIMAFGSKRIRMDYESRIKNLTQYQTYCVIPIVVVNVLPRSQAVNPERAVYSALFRLGISVLCMVVLIALEVKKFQLRKASKAAEASSRAADGVQYPRE